MRDQEILLTIEALLFATPEPLTQKQVNLIFEDQAPRLDQVIPQLRDKLERESHAYEIQSIAGGYQLSTRKEFAPWVRRLLERPGQLQLSVPALEALSIVAYKQPLSRFEIESIRGVDCSAVLRTLLTRRLIRIVGRDRGPGRPLLYATTGEFLRSFGLDRLADLPRLKEIEDLTGEQPARTEKTDALE